FCFQAEDGIRDDLVTGVQTCALPIFVELLYGAGLRVSEAVNLARNGVDLDDRLVRVIGKGDKERVVPVGRQAVEALRRYLSRGRSEERRVGKASGWRGGAGRFRT